MKEIIIRQVELSEEQFENRCETCGLNKANQCLTNVKSFLVNSHGFNSCNLGYNYSIEEIEIDSALDKLPEPATLDEALRVISNLKSLNSIQRIALKRSTMLLRELEGVK